MGADKAALTAGERAEIDRELRAATEALSVGNEGKARVCARRASGVALRAWRRHCGDSSGVPADAQSLLLIAATDANAPAVVRDAAGRLSASVTAPPGSATTDPLADARLLIDALTSPGLSADA